MSPVCRFEDEVSESRADDLSARLTDWNLAGRGAIFRSHDPVPLHVFALDSNGRLVGGVVAKTTWGWLEVGTLWVDDGNRDQGLGTELVLKAEAAARFRGCTRSRLTTFEFQAPEFYRRLGYTEYGQLTDYPAGHTVIYFRKDL